MHLESPHRIPIIGRDKNDGGHPLAGDRVEDRETIHLRHLHIQVDQVGPGSLDGGNGLLSIRTLAHNLDLRIVTEESANAFPAQRFVIHDERSDFQPRPPSLLEAFAGGGINRNGKASFTDNPPSAALLNSKVCASP